MGLSHNAAFDANALVFPIKNQLRLYKKKLKWPDKVDESITIKLDVSVEQRRAYMPVYTVYTPCDLEPN